MAGRKDKPIGVHDVPQPWKHRLASSKKPFLDQFGFLSETIDCMILDVELVERCIMKVIFSLTHDALF
jgi:hypothetical protein